MLQESIQQFESKFFSLLQDYQTLKTENASLKELVQLMESQAEEFNRSRSQETNQQQEATENYKNKIDYYVAEIDKILNQFDTPKE